MDTFFWILGKFLGSKYPSIYDHPPIYNLQNPYLGLGYERRYWGEAVLEGAVWGGGGKCTLGSDPGKVFQFERLVVRGGHGGNLVILLNSL